jgi:hypothetical protein
MAALTSLYLRLPKYVKTGTDAKLSSSQACKLIDYVKGKRF